MKILFISADITKMGGTERAVINTINNLQQIGVDCSIVSFSNPSNTKTFFPLDSRVNIIYSNVPPIPISLKLKIAWYYKILFLNKNKIDLNRYDKIFTVGHNITAVVILRNLLVSKKIYACEHINFNSLSYVSRLFVKCLYRFISGVIVLNEVQKKKFKFLAENKVFVIPNSIPFIPDLQSNLKAKKIIMLGRLSKEKGLDRLLDIAQGLQKYIKDWTIDIYGDGEMRFWLEDNIKRKGLKDIVILKGCLSDVKMAYCTGSIYIMTSYTEAMPMVLIEAMSCGLPVVAYELDVLHELIENEFNGFIIKNNSVSDFISKLILLIENYELRAELGNAAQEFSYSFNSMSVNKKWLDLLNK